jgi:glutamate-1-semialdehyde 2,1-aminomutase
MPVGALVGRKEIMEKTSPERKADKWEKILIGGGTFSSHPLTVAAGIAILRYLRDFEEEIYPVLEVKGERVRKGVQEALQREGVETVVTGIGSLFQTHFPFQKGVTLNSPHSINQLTDTEKREVEFRIRMLNKGVHVMHGGGSLSMAHTDEDIERIIGATREVAREMAN